MATVDTDPPDPPRPLPFPDKDTLVIAGTVGAPVWSTLGEWEIADGCVWKTQDREPPIDSDSRWQPLSVPIHATKGGELKPLRYYDAKCQRVFVQLGRGGFIDTPERRTKLGKIKRLLEDKTRRDKEKAEVKARGRAEANGGVVATNNDA
jgi:hypothetical protein